MMILSARGMKKLGLSLAASILFGTLPTQAATLTASGYQIFLDGVPFVIKGVNYSPVPIGVKPSDPPYGDYFVANYRNVWQPDIAQMRAAGVNCIKLYAGNPGANAGAPNSAGNWKPFLDELWNNGDRPIYVMMFSFTLGGQIQAGGAAYQGYVNDYTRMVKSTVNHPAVIGYVVGNEIFGDAGYVNNPNSAFWKNFGALITAVHQAGLAQGKNPFVTTAITDGRLNNTWPAIQFGETSNQLAKLDAWSINVYRGPDFGGDGPNSVFKQYLQQMQAVGKVRPLIIGEWGTQHSTRPIGVYGQSGLGALPISLDTISPDQMGAGKPYFAAQPVGKFLTEQWNTLKADIAAGAGKQVAVGGFVFGWADEYWKGDNVNQHVGGPGDQAFLGGSFAGGYADEAWYGLTEALSASKYGSGKPNITRAQFDGYRAMSQFYNASGLRGSQLYSSADTRPPTVAVRRQSAERRVAAPRALTAPLGVIKPVYVLRGTASDDTRLAGVVVRGNGDVRIARGRSKWTIPMTLKSGRNVFTVRAFDTAGNKSKRVRVVVFGDF